MTGAKFNRIVGVIAIFVYEYRLPIPEVDSKVEWSAAPREGRALRELAELDLD
jgi:hypothetical protein